MRRAAILSAKGQMTLNFFCLYSELAKPFSPVVWRQDSCINITVRNFSDGITKVLRLLH